MTLLLVALGGALGAVSRFVLDGLIRERVRTRLPLATMTINVTGSLLIGLLAGAVTFHGVDPTAIVPLTSGFCGGYTTFSTAMVETVRLVQSGEVRRAVVAVLGSLVLTVAAAALGMAIMAWTA